MRLHIRLTASPSQHIPDKDPAIRQDEHRDWSQQNEIREYERPVYDFPAFEREGLDSPQYRTGSAIDGVSQEMPLITDHHVGNVVQHTTNYFNDSVGAGRDFIAAAVDGQPDHSRPIFSGELTLSGIEGADFFSLDRDHLARFLGLGPVFCRAVMSDGRDLPEWLSFDHQSLTVTVVDPAQLLEEDEVHVRAVNSQGRQYTMIIKLKPWDQADPTIEAGAGPEPAEAAPEPAETDPAADLSVGLGPERFLSEAGASFGSLWAVSAEARETDLARDTDLDQKLEDQALSSLWLKARKMMAELAS